MKQAQRSDRKAALAAIRVVEFQPSELKGKDYTVTDVGSENIYVRLGSGQRGFVKDPTFYCLHYR